MLSRRRLDAWGGAFFALIGVAGCGGISESEDSGAGGTGGGATGGTGQGATSSGGTAGSMPIAGGGGTGPVNEIHGPCSGDGDCSPGKACVAFVDNCQSGRACQTSRDECATHADCDAGLVCMPDPDWIKRCRQINCFEGRPFLIDGEARVADTSERADWIAREALAAAEPIDERLRDVLHRRWREAARMEHASVAAFARFSLELLALGAPSDLVLEAARAMQDETIHAELCFGLASRYGDRVLGPGPLSPDSALDGISLESAVKNTLLEGCIGETLAAAEAQAACEHVKDPVVRGILERIAADETRHAALAFRFVSWAIGRGDAHIQELVRQTLLERPRFADEAAVDAVPDATLFAAGVLPGHQRADVRRYAYETVVLRALRSLLNEPETTTYPAVASC